MIKLPIFSRERSNAFLLLIPMCLMMATACSSNTQEGQQTRQENDGATVQMEEEPGESTTTGESTTNSIDLTAEIDPALVEKGKAVFDVKCVACHMFDTRMIGPALAGVTQRRQPDWIMNMVMDPVMMTETDSIAKALLAEYGIQMINQNINEEDARALLEYFRDYDKNMAE